jgi:hypothetical protein
MRTTVLDGVTDLRGTSFTAGSLWLKFLEQLKDTHVSVLLPGHSRGNHFHKHKKEVLIVLFSDSWRLSWDSGEGTSAMKRDFSGTGAVLVEVDPLSSHAVSNTGHMPLWTIGLSNAMWDSDHPDAFSRQVTTV